MREYNIYCLNSIIQYFTFNTVHIAIAHPQAYKVDARQIKYRWIHKENVTYKSAAKLGSEGQLTRNATARCITAKLILSTHTCLAFIGLICIQKDSKFNSAPNDNSCIIFCRVQKRILLKTTRSVVRRQEKRRVLKR